MFVKDGWEPKPEFKHDMTPWKSTIVTFSSGNSRFGRIRRCKNCDAEHADGMQPSGGEVHDELATTCEGA